MWSVQEAAGTRLLHHLSPGVTAHPAEGVITEDDGAVLHLRVGDNKLSIFGRKQKGWLRKVTSGGGRRGETIKRGSSRHVFIQGKKQKLLQIKTGTVMLYHGKQIR